MLGIVVGLTAEAPLARGLGGVVAVGGGKVAGAEAAAEQLVAGGAQALLSFGVAGGLAPGLLPGAIVIPASVMDEAGARWAVDGALAARLGAADGSILAAADILVSVAAKRAAWQATGACAVDIESGPVARVAAAHHLPFAVLRAVCDPAERDMPSVALAAIDAHGSIQTTALLRALARHPGQIPALVALGREASRARRALLAHVAAVGPIAPGTA